MPVKNKSPSPVTSKPTSVPLAPTGALEATLARAGCTSTPSERQLGGVAPRRPARPEAPPPTLPIEPLRGIP